MDYLLIIDDDELICQNVQSKLVRLGYVEKYQLLMTTSCSEAQWLYDKYRPAVVITDIQMPVMSGLTLIRQFNASEHQAKIFVLSSYDDYDYVRNAFLLGVTDYILKPISIEELRKKMADFNPVPVSREKPSGDSMVAAVRYIEENLHQSINMADVANHVCISYTHFSRLFKAYTGQSFNRYLNEKRLEQAKKYLKDPIIKIQAIANKVGYQNSSEFSRAFKHYLGLYPTEYRGRYFGKRE